MAAAAIFCGSVLAGEPRFTELTTRDFVLVSSSGEHQARRTAGRIAMFQAALTQIFGVRLTSRTPTRIFALSAAEWARYVQPRADAAGYFVAHPFSNDLLFDAEASRARALELMFHEYTHHLLRTLGAGTYPAFFDEGLAEVFSTARFDEDTVTFAARPEHVAFLRRNEWLPFERLVEIKRRDAEYVDHTLAPAFYAQAWATVYFAIAADSRFGGRLIDYIRGLNAGVSHQQAAELLIGDVSARANQDIAAFILARRPLPTAAIRVGRAGRLEQPLTVRRLDAGEHDLLLGELVLRLGNRSEAALQFFGGKHDTQERQARARIGRGVAHLQAGRREMATQLLDDADLPPDLPCEAAVRLGRGLFQLSLRDGDLSKEPDESQRQQLEQAHARFAGALRDEACWLPATNGYVLTSLALNDIDPSLIDLAGKAYAAAPRSAELAVSLALLHELDGRKEAARPYWVAAARHLHEGPTRAKILDNLERSGSAFTLPDGSGKVAR